MPGFTRRSKPLKGTVALTDLDNFAIANPSDSDLIVYDSGTGNWINSKALTGDYTIAGSLTVNSIVLSAGISLGTDISATGNLDIGGNAEIDGTLLVGGTTTLAGVNATGNATIGGTLGVTGTLTGSAFSFSGSGTVDTNLTVTGTLTAGTLSLTDLDLTGNFSVAGTSDFTDAVSMQADLTVNANITGAAVSGSTVSATGQLSFGTVLSGPRFGVSRSAPDITWQNTTNDDTILFRGAYDVGAGQVLTDMLKLTPNVGGTLTGDLTVTNDILLSDATAALIDLTTDSATLTLRGRTSGSANSTLATFDPDGASQLNHAGTLMVKTSSNALGIYHTTATSPALYFYDNSETRQMFILSQATDAIWRGETVSGRLLLQAKSSGSVNRAVVYGDPDAGVKLFYQGTEELDTISGSIKFGTHSAIGAETVTGFITIQDSGGTTRKLAVVS